MVGRPGHWDAPRVRRLQGSAGQTNVEWLAVMACIVAIVAGVIASTHSIGASIVDTARTAICKVGGMSCSSGSSRPKNGLDPSAPTSGPAIGGHPRNVGAGLPFPGSVSVTVDPSKSGGTNGDPDYEGPKAGYK